MPGLRCLCPLAPVSQCNDFFPRHGFFCCSMERRPQKKVQTCLCKESRQAEALLLLKVTQAELLGKMY